MTRDKTGRTPGGDTGPAGTGLDSAIDDAVRAMMNVDADEAFRARVLARVEHRRPLHLTGFRVVFAAAGCAAAVILAVLLTRPSAPARIAPVEQAVASTDSAAPARGTAPEAAAVERDVAVSSPTPLVAEGRTAGTRGRRGVMTAAVAEETSAVEIVPLAEITPIGIAGATPPPITTQEIAIAPLTPIAAVQIEPLSPQTERD
jgi:hypothetical protein